MKKTMFARILAAMMLAAALPAISAEVTHTFRWVAPHSEVTTLTVPMRGGLLLVDSKRAPAETQWLRFRINTGDYFEVWEKDHIFVLLDGYFNFEPNQAVPYAARGVILDRFGMHIENFSNADLFGFVPVAWQRGRTYEVIVHASRSHVAGWVAEITSHSWGIEIRRDLAMTHAAVPDQTPGKRVSLMVIGALADFTANPAGTSSKLHISRIEHGRFTVGP